MSKRQQLIDTAFKLFYQHGINAVGINQVLEASGVAKQTLYNHFDSKESLVAAVVRARDDAYMNWFAGRLESVPKGTEALLAVFDAIDDWFNDRVQSLYSFHGCFFINTCSEFGSIDHPIHQQCANHKRNVFELIKGHASLVTPDPVDAERLANGIYMLKEGATVKAHVEGDRDAALKAKETVKLLLTYGVQNSKKDQVLP